ncbi:MAG: ribbon-helix-helix protein, CopG family [Sphingomonas sp.]
MLGVRLDADAERQLAALARRTSRTKSDIVREAVSQYVSAHDDAYLAEARRQSLRAAKRDDAAILDMLDAALDDTIERYGKQ